MGRCTWQLIDENLNSAAFTSAAASTPPPLAASTSLAAVSAPPPPTTSTLATVSTLPPTAAVASSSILAAISTSLAAASTPSPPAAAATASLPNPQTIVPTEWQKLQQRLMELLDEGLIQLFEEKDEANEIYRHVKGAFERSGEGRKLKDTDSFVLLHIGFRKRVKSHYKRVSV